MITHPKSLPEPCRTEVERHLGHALSSEQVNVLARLVTERSRRLRLSPNAYARLLREGNTPEEVLTLAGHFTVGESYFFRDTAQLNMCCALISKLLCEATPERPVRVLSAGCSTGEEPYTLLMSLHDQLMVPELLRVTALDINRAALDRAARGRYSSWSLRETPNDVRDRWFRFDGREYHLSTDITARVAFQCGSLIQPGELLPEHGFDVILCRNVLMYFSNDAYRAAARDLVNALVPSGHLLLGHAESLRGLGLPVELVQLGDSFCYRKSTPTVANCDPLTSLLQSIPPMTSHFGTERQGATLGVPLQTALAPHVVTHPVTQSSVLTCELAKLVSVTPLVESERFADALTELETSSCSNPHVRQLCQSLLLVYTNQFDAAVAIATPLSNVEAIAAEAHYTLALCREQACDWESASSFARRATYLNPTFAMAWLHLGILSRKRGDVLAARRELLQARALLTIEPAERLLWFAGGCSRATLEAACERELAATGDMS